MGQSPGYTGSSNNFVSLLYFPKANNMVLKRPFNALKDGQVYRFIVRLSFFSNFHSQSTGQIMASSCIFDYSDCFEIAAVMDFNTVASTGDTVASIMQD
jgi:hypothetical protein